MELSKFNIRDKIELYRYLMKNGFEPLDNEKLRSSPLSEFTVEEIKSLLEKYKSTDKKHSLGDLVFKILDSKQYYKHDFFNTIFSDVIFKKASSFPEGSDYRQAYLFIAQLLQGEFPCLENISKKSMTILLILIQEMQMLVNSMDTNKLFVQNEQSNQTNDQIHSNDNNSSEKQVMETLNSMFKFQKISEFMNPLNISCDANQKLMEIFSRSLNT